MKTNSKGNPHALVKASKNLTEAMYLNAQNLKGSYEQLREDVRGSIAEELFPNSKTPYGGQETFFCMEALFPKYALISVRLDKMGKPVPFYGSVGEQSYMKVPYTVDEEGEVELKEPVKVKVTLAEVDEMIKTEGGIASVSLMLDSASSTNIFKSLTEAYRGNGGPAHKGDGSVCVYGPSAKGLGKGTGGEHDDSETETHKSTISKRVVGKKKVKVSKSGTMSVIVTPEEGGQGTPVGKSKDEAVDKTKVSLMKRIMDRIKTMKEPELVARGIKKGMRVPGIGDPDDTND